MAERKLYLDCDGVLADFDRGAEMVLGLPPRVFEQRHGRGPFWARLAQAPDFFANLPLMPGASELFAAVRHLHPVILTGLPRGNWAAAQKVRWAARHFPGTKIITTLAADKRDHCRSGDVLVDDTLKYRHLWEAAGGIFVHYQDAGQALEELAGWFDLHHVAHR
jgi:5'(3')-deoxyribonucleotidase